MNGPYSVQEAAKRLKKEPRWLNEFLRNNPFDRDGQPLYRLAGRTKLLAEDALTHLARDFEDDPIKTGHIYFVAAGDAIKIGFTRELKSRIASLQTSAVESLKLLGTIEGTLFEERKLHERFAQHRVRGEWFKSSPDLLAFIERVAQ